MGDICFLGPADGCLSFFVLIQMLAPLRSTAVLKYVYTFSDLVLGKLQELLEF